MLFPLFPQPKQRGEQPGAAPLLAVPLVPPVPRWKMKGESRMGRFDHLADILDLPRTAAPAPASHPTPSAGAFTWRLTIDGRGMTVIDPLRRTPEQMRHDMAVKFGAERIEGLERIR